VACSRDIVVPDERAANPRLKIRCTCATLFALADAPIAVAAPAPPSPATATPTGAGSGTPAAAATVPRSGAQPAGIASERAHAASERRPSRPVPWRRCSSHPHQRSESVCPACLVGYCASCERKVQGGSICSACDGLCVRTVDLEEKEARRVQRARSMMDDVGTLLSYPFRDPTAYVMLALFTWFFGLFAGFSGFAVVLSRGVLTWYCFHALTKVAGGNLKDFMPDFGDISDLVRPLRLGFTALVAGTGPLFLLLVLVPGLAAARSLITPGAATADVDQAQLVPDPGVPHEAEQAAGLGATADQDLGEFAVEDAVAGAGLSGPEPGFDTAPAEEPSPLLLALLLAAAIWSLAYTPVALIVAALSRSMLSTLNPLLGVDTIRKMGPVYWQAMGLYSALVAVQWGLGSGLRLIPFAGGLGAAFVDAYGYLAIGCTLGLAVFKKGEELGWD
jgi:hypothetical protein